MPPLTGRAKADYIARALANPNPDINDELDKLGFQAASELSKSRAALRSHIDAIHAPSPGGAVSASPKIVNGAVVGGNLVHPGPRLEAAGPDTRSESQKAADLRRNTDVALSAGLDKSGINADLAGASKITNTAGNIVANVATALIPAPIVTIAAKARGEKVSGTDYALEAAGIVPILRGPRALIRAGKAIKAGEDASVAVKAARASLKEVGPISQAVKKIPTRTLRAGNLSVEIPAARSRTGRLVETLVDNAIRPVTSKVGVMTEAGAAGKELGYSTKFKIDMLRSTADALAKVGRKLSDAEEYALRVVAEQVPPTERAAFHIAQAATSKEKANAVFHAIHADMSQKAAKYIDVVNDPERGWIPVISKNAPKALREADTLFKETGDAREQLLGELGRLSDEQITRRAAQPGQILRGAQWVEPTPGKLGKPSQRLLDARANVARIEKKVAQAEKVTSRMRYSAADLKRIGSIAVDPGLEDRLQAHLDELNTLIRENRPKPAIPSDEAKSLIEERRSLKRLAAFHEGLQKIAGEYSAEAQALGEKGASITGTDPNEVIARIQELDHAIADAGGRISRFGDPELAKVESAAQRARNALKRVRANPLAIQEANRVILPSGHVVEPIGQVSLDRHNAALSVARERLQQLEARAARAVEPTGIVGGGVGRDVQTGAIMEGPQRASLPGADYAPMWRGAPVGRVESVRQGVNAYTKKVHVLFGGGGRKAIGGGPDDVHLRKAFKGSLLTSGFFTKDVVGPKVESLIIAARMSAAHVAHSSLVKAATDLPTHETDIPIKLDPRKPIGYAENAAARQSNQALNAYYDFIDSMQTRTGKVRLKDLEGVDFHVIEQARQDLFPSAIDGQRTTEVALQAISDRKPIPNIGWISRDFLDRTNLLYVPSAARFANANVPANIRAGWNATSLTWDGLNDLQKALVTFLNPAYIPVNLIGNLAMNTMQQGVFLPRNMLDAIKMHGALDTVQRVQIDKAMGHTLTNALSMQTKPGDLLKHTIGRYVGNATDLIPRRAAFLHEANRSGYRISGKGGKQDLGSLLDLARKGDEAALHEVEMISRRAQEAIVNFDRLNPFEREVLARWIFFYPWLKGATRYSQRFIMDHPVQAMAIALAYEHAQAASQEMLGDRPYYAKMQVPISTRSLGFKLPGVGDVGLNQAVGEHTATGPNGEPLTVNFRQLFTPTTPLELAQAGISFLGIGPKEPAADIAQMLTPVPYAAMVAVSGYDPFTKKKVQPGLGTFFEQFGPLNSPIKDRIEAFNMSPEERRKRNEKALNPRTKTQDVSRTFLGGLSPQGYSRDVGERRALEGKPALERQTKTLILDSKKYGLGTPPKSVLDELKVRVSLQSSIKRNDTPIEKALKVAELFDKTQPGSGMVEVAKTMTDDLSADGFYRELAPYLYPSLLSWEARIKSQQDVGKAEHLTK